MCTKKRGDLSLERYFQAEHADERWLSIGICPGCCGGGLASSPGPPDLSTTPGAWRRRRHEASGGPCTCTKRALVIECLRKFGQE